MEQPEVPGLEPGNGSVIPGQLVLDSKENSQDIGNKRQCFQDLSGGAVDKNPPANVGDLGLISGLGRSPGRGHGNPLQDSCLETPIHRGA